MNSSANPRIAIVAMQGDFSKHIEMLSRIGVMSFAARSPEDIKSSDAIIIPGGESTTIIRLMKRYGVDEAIKEAADSGKPIYGSCAGMIVLANKIAVDTSERGGQTTLGLLDITVARNAFGRQVDSFEADLSIPDLGTELLHAVFIRAPYAVEIGPAVHVLSTYDNKAVFVQQDLILASSFHPELTIDVRVHLHFLSLIKSS